MNSRSGTKVNVFAPAAAIQWQMVILLLETFHSFFYIYNLLYMGLKKTPGTAVKEKNQQLTGQKNISDSRGCLNKAADVIREKPLFSPTQRGYKNSLSACEGSSKKVQSIKKKSPSSSLIAINASNFLSLTVFLRSKVPNGHNRTSR